MLTRCPGDTEVHSEGTFLPGSSPMLCDLDVSSLLSIPGGFIPGPGPFQRLQRQPARGPHRGPEAGAEWARAGGGLPAAQDHHPEPWVRVQRCRHQAESLWGFPFFSAAWWSIFEWRKMSATLVQNVPWHWKSLPWKLVSGWALANGVGVDGFLCVPEIQGWGVDQAPWTLPRIALGACWNSRFLGFPLAMPVIHI